MPNPTSVRCVRKFWDVDQAMAYRDGLAEGLNAASQPGTDPWRVRMEVDLCAPYDWSVYLEWGRYDLNGRVYWGWPEDDPKMTPDISAARRIAPSSAYGWCVETSALVNKCWCFVPHGTFVPFMTRF